MSPLFPSVIAHTPPAHCVRVHRLIDGDEYLAESGKNIPLTLGRNIRLVKWLADEPEPLTTNCIAERSGLTPQNGHYVLHMLLNAGVVRIAERKPVRWAWVWVPE